MFPIPHQAPPVDVSLPNWGRVWNEGMSALDSQLLGGINGHDPVPKPAVPAEVPDALQISEEQQLSTDIVDGNAARLSYKQNLMPDFQGMQGPGVAVMPMGLNYGTVGGQDQWQELWDRPRKVEEAINAGAQAEADRSQAKADYLKQFKEETDGRLAGMEAARSYDQARLQMRQRELDKNVEKYSADLADTGKFWSNPGNIIAAIGAAFIAFASPDKSAGIKLIQQQVDADFQKRRAAADMHLGELRSNVAGYRQLMQDKQAGDAMALSMSYKQAGMDLERISAQFEGPILKAKGAAMAQEFYQKAELIKAQLTAQVLYNAPRAEKIPIAAEYKKSGMFQPYAKDQAQAPAQQAPGSFGRGLGAAVGQAPQQPGSGVNQAMRAVNGGQPTVVDKAVDSHLSKKGVNPKVAELWDKRAPGANAQLEMFRNEIARRAVIKAGPGATKARLQQVADELIEGYDKEASEKIAPAMKDKTDGVRSWGKFANDLRGFEAFARATGQDPNVLLRSARDYTPEAWSSFITDLKRKYSDPKSAEDAQALANLDKVERIHQMMAAKSVDWYHKQFGGAMSEQELGKGAAYITNNAPFQKWMQFAADGSRRAASEIQEALSMSTAGPAGTLYLLSIGRQSPEMDKPGAKKTEAK